MRTYEAVFILDDRKFEDGGDAFARDITSHIKGLGGKVKEKNGLGRKQFSRPIEKHSAGLYWDFLFEMEPAKVGTFEDKYRLNTSVLRLNVFLVAAAALKPRRPAAPPKVETEG